MNTHGKKRKIHQGIENLKRSDRRQEKSLAKQAHQVKPDKILVKELNTKLFDEYLALNENCLKEICGVLEKKDSPGEKILTVDLLKGTKKRPGARIPEVSLITEACKLERWRSVLEIGVGSGISTVSFANTLKNRGDDKTQFQTIDYSDCVAINRAITANRQKNIKKLQEIIKHENWDHSDIGTNAWFSVELKKENKKRFNVVFIDGDHSRDQTEADWKNVEKCLEEDFIVFFHDLTAHTQQMAYPLVARYVFEQIDVDKYEKLILDTPFRLGVVYPKGKRETELWLEENLRSLEIKIWEANPTGPPSSFKGF